MPKLWIFGRSHDTAVISCKKKDEVPNHNKCVEGDKESELSSSIEMSSSLVEKKPEEPSTLFYAVALPCSNGDVKDKEPFVFLNKKDALKVVVKNEGARFKVFRSREEAIHFALQPLEPICKTPKAELSPSSPACDTEKNSDSSEKSLQFRGPKSQCMVKLRKLIAAGDVGQFSLTVWSNPRYLITSVDTPTVFQEGFHYNALHIAAKNKQPQLCEEIIKTIENPSFLKLLYSDDSEEIRQQRMFHIVDLYLNMPDKGLCETPLHFAAKFGCLKCVRILASHPACDKTIQNKHGLLAKEIICERCPSASIHFKQQIEEAFQEKYFVPVLRYEDNSMQPSVGKPCTKDDVEVAQSAGTSSPCGSMLTVMAYAGPMSPERADKFYKNWKTPPSYFSKANYKELHKIRLRDNEKGLERIGRNLARTFKTAWIEFWPTLNAWCDLSSEEGLRVLEKHLREMHHKVKSMELSRLASFTDLNGSYQSIDSTVESSDASSSSSSGVSRMCSRLEKFHMHNLSSDSNSSSHNAISEFEYNSNHSSSLKQTFDYSFKNNCLQYKPEIEHVMGKTQNGKKSAHYENTKGIINNIKAKYERPQQNSCKENKLNPVFPSKEHVQNHCFVFSLEDKIVRNHIKELPSREDTHQFLFSMNNIILCMLNVFSVLTLNPDVMDGKAVRDLAEDVLPELQCLLKFCQSVHLDFSKIHSFIAQQIYKEMPNQFLQHEENVIFRLVSSYLERYFFVPSLEEEELSMRDEVLWQHFNCILRCFCSMFLNRMSKHRPCDCKWTRCPGQPERFAMFGDYSRYTMGNKNTEKNNFQSSASPESSSDDEFYTPPGSPELSSDDEPVTPDEGLEVFVDGDIPSKADLDILNAIESVTVDPHIYPYISEWKHLMSLKDKKMLERYSLYVVGARFYLSASVVFQSCSSENEKFVDTS